MPRKYIKWDDEKIKFIVEQYTSQKMNTYDLAQYFGCSDDTIGRRLKEQGITLHKFYEDLSGKKIGKLTVIKKSDKSDRRLYWDCICECGKEITVKGDHLRQKNQLSCGCLTSKGEQIIGDILNFNNIQYISQYHFSDFTAEVNNIPYRFDFAIFKDSKLEYLIEYDGEQHFHYLQNTKGWNTKENFEKTQKLDKKKNEYCFKNNIPLIRIPYTIKDKINIEDLKLESSKYIVRKD